MSEILTSIGVIITVLACLYTFRITNWSKIVSESRNRWINDFRDEIATIVGTIKIINSYLNKNVEECNFDNSEFILDKIYQAEVARARLLTKLNTSSIIGNRNNFPLKELLESIEFKCFKETDDYIVDEIIDATKKILEPEWKRVKDEARGKRK